MKDVFKQMRKEREKSLFRLKNMIIHGSHLFSLIFVTSILSPRHIRWTLFICNITMLWFICAVYFNNTKDPLVVPDFSTDASSLAMNEMWISFVAPIGSMMLMYVVSCFLKMPNSQFVNNVTLRQLEIAVLEYKKEQTMRFFMGYLVVSCIMGYIFYYIVNFTAMFGWKVSWIWYYTGFMSIFMQIIFYDPLVSFIHWLIYRYYKKGGRLLQKCRSMSQGYNETYDLSEGEEEEKKRLEEEEKLRAKNEKKKTVVKKKKKKAIKDMFAGEDNGGDMFGESVNKDMVQEFGPIPENEGGINDHGSSEELQRLNAPTAKSGSESGSDS